MAPRWPPVGGPNSSQIATSDGFRVIQFLSVTDVTNRFSLKECILKVVRYEITKLMTLEWSLYDNFSPSYGRFRVFELRNPYFGAEISISPDTLEKQSCPL